MTDTKQGKTRTEPTWPRPFSRVLETQVPSLGGCVPGDRTPALLLSALLGKHWKMYKEHCSVYTRLSVSSCPRGWCSWGHRGDSREATWPRGTGRRHLGELQAETGHWGCGALDQHRPESDGPAPQRGTRTRAGTSTGPVSRCAPPSPTRVFHAANRKQRSPDGGPRSKSKRDVVQTDHLSGSSLQMEIPRPLSVCTTGTGFSSSQDRVPATGAKCTRVRAAGREGP